MATDSLPTLLAQHGLETYLAGFRKHGVDAAELAALSEADLVELASKLAMPLGHRARLRKLCESQRRAMDAAAAGQGFAGIAPPPNPPAAPAHQPASTLPPLDPPLEAELIDNLPTPIARAAHCLIEASDPMHLSDAIDTTIDTMLRFIALACKADYLAAPNWHDPRLNELFVKMDRPALGDWWAFIDRSIRGSEEAKHPLFLAELRDTWIRSERDKPEQNEGAVWNEVCQEERRQARLGTLEWLLNLRNAYAHRKLPRQDEAPALRGREVAARAIREYRWLRDYELWVSDGTAMALLRGRGGRSEPGGPSELRRSKGVALRRRSPHARGGRRTLELPPLIISDAMIAAAVSGTSGDAATALFYGEIRSDREIHYSGPDPHGVVRQHATTRHLDDLRRRQEAKAFSRLRRSDLSYEALLSRVKAATERTLRILEQTLKFRRELHIERATYEPKLAAWIDSPLPLLGIAAEAGAGKTGIFASLVHRWRESSDKPVLLLLARDFQSMATIDRLIRRTLVLDDDVAATDVADALAGLVVVVDGLNEHPNRIDLLDGIRNLARAGAQTGRGPRFAISWRTEDEDWMQSALSERSLWWTPPSNSGLQQLTEWLPDRDKEQDGEESGEPDSDAGKGHGASGRSSRSRRSSSAAQRSEVGRATTGRRAGAGETAPDRGETAAFVTVKAFTNAEVAAAWERYRSHDQQRMSPRFDWASLQQESPELSWDLHNPLRMRIAMECYHGQPLPEHLRVEQVFETYLDTLRPVLPGDSVSDLLALLGAMMHSSRETRFDKAEIEQQRYDLVYGGDLPAFDFLVRRGVLSVLDEQGRTAFTFTVERVAEQVLGEHLATLPETATAEGLARLADHMPGSEFMLGPGAIRVALRLRVAQKGRDFLYEFIDAHPEGVGRLAAGALASLIVSAGEAGAASIAEELLAEPTDADCEVAEQAAVYFYRRDRYEIERAFLEPFVGPEHRSRIESSKAAADLAVEYIDCVLSAAEAGAGAAPSADAFDPATDETIGNVLAALRVLSAGGLTDASGPLGQALRLLGQWQMRQRRIEAAIDLFGEWVEAARAAGGARPDAAQRRLLAVALEWLGNSLREATQFEDALDTYREAIETGMNPERCEEWSPAGVRAAIAAVHTAREEWDEAIKAEEQCLEARLADGETADACRAASRLGVLHGKRGDADSNIEWQRRAVEIARGGSDRRDVAWAFEWLGNALREADQFDEALECYREAVETGMNPERCTDWSPSHVWAMIAKVHEAREEWDEAIKAEEQCLEANLADGETAGACRAASRLGVLHGKRGDADSNIEWQRRAVEIARGGSDRRDVAWAFEWLGDALREAERFDEAMAAYRDSYAYLDARYRQSWRDAGAYAQRKMGTSYMSDRGTAIHALFETIGFIEDGVPDDEELDRAIRRALPRCKSEYRIWWIAEFREMLTAPAIAACLARPEDGPSRVWRERSIVCFDGGELRRGILDRLVVVGEPGALRRAEILDFKTDAFETNPPSADELAARTEYYRPQLLGYRNAVTKQYRLNSTRIALRLVFVGAGVVLNA